MARTQIVVLEAILAALERLESQRPADWKGRLEAVGELPVEPVEAPLEGEPIP